MKRRDFLRIFLLGGILSIFSKKTKAEEKPEKALKEAMFWKRLD
jgi:cbb3-type cytochrome oxidase subunit 3